MRHHADDRWEGAEACHRPGPSRHRSGGTGALHLGAGLAEAALGRFDRALERLAEATRLADGLPDGLGFGGMVFGPTNVKVWRLAIAVEVGEGGRVRELAAGWDVRAIPSPGRHADYWTELGRGLATSKATAEDAVAALVRAEALAPHRIRAHPLIRETVVGGQAGRHSWPCRIHDYARRAVNAGPGRTLSRSGSCPAR